jgi:methyl-accepting chemotaxis protein
MQEKIKRRKIIVKKVQLKYAAVILIAMLVTAVTVGADFYVRLYGFIGDFLKDLPDRNVENLMSSMNQLMYAKIIVLIVIAVAISLYVSHKFAGPIVHLEKSIERIASGDLTHKIYLRSGDELKYLADYFNYMVGRFKSFVESDRKITNDVLVKLEEIKEKVIDTESKEKIESIQADLRKITENWNT